jgi:hypothetical protein
VSPAQEVSCAGGTVHGRTWKGGWAMQLAGAAGAPEGSGQRSQLHVTSPRGQPHGPRRLPPTNQSCSLWCMPPPKSMHAAGSVAPPHNCKPCSQGWPPDPTEHQCSQVWPPLPHQLPIMQPAVHAFPATCSPVKSPDECSQQCPPHDTHAASATCLPLQYQARQLAERQHHGGTASRGSTLHMRGFCSHCRWRQRTPPSPADCGSPPGAHCQQPGAGRWRHPASHPHHEVSVRCCSHGPNSTTRQGR